MARKLFESLGLFVTFCVIALMLRDAPMPWGDGRFYFEMASDPGRFVGSPYGYRIGVPYLAAALVSITGSDLYEAFGFVQIGSFAAFMTLMFVWISRGLGMGRFVAALASVLCVLSPAGLYNLRNPFVVGFAEYFLLLLGCIAIYHRRFALLLVVVLVASPFKETVGLLLVPTFFIFVAGDGQWKEALRGGALLAAVSAAGALLLRSGAIFTTSSGLDEYLSFYTMDYVGAVQSSWGGLLGATIAVALTLGSGWLLGAAGFLSAPKRFRLLSSLAIFAVLQIALATDVERMVAAGIPVLGPLFAFALARVDWKRALVLMAAVSAYFSAHFVAPHLAMRGSSWTGWVVVAYVGSAVLTLAALRGTERDRGFRGSQGAVAESGDVGR